MLIAALIGIILLTAADQLIKYWVVQDLKPVGSVPFLHIGDHKILDLTYLENNGAVFSSFAGMRWLLVGTTVILMAFCAYWLVRHGKKSKLLTVSQVLFFKSQKKIFRCVRKVVRETGEFLSDKELRRFFANGACYAKAVREKRSYELR